MQLLAFDDHEFAGLFRIVGIHGMFHRAAIVSIVITGPSLFVAWKLDDENTIEVCAFARFMCAAAGEHFCVEALRNGFP